MSNPMDDYTTYGTILTKFLFGCKENVMQPTVISAFVIAV
jgi:hypothetical protein